MRHQRAGKRLSRGRKTRKALLRNLASSLFKHGQIQTTEAKAKVARPLIDKLLTQARKGTLDARRRLFAFLGDRTIVERLVAELVPKFRGRTSGFTRIIRLGERSGDGAMVVKMELVEFPETKAAVKPTRKPIVKEAPQKRASRPSRTKTTKKKTRIQKKTV